MALPTGYTQIEYIEATGTQYIDLRLAIDRNMTVVIDAAFRSTQNWSALYGVTDNIAKFRHNILLITRDSGPAYEFTYQDGQMAVASLGSYVAGRHKFKAVKSGDHYTFYIDDAAQGSTIYNNGTVTGTSYYAYLFASHDVTSSSNTAQIKARARIYEATISGANGVVYRHMLPAIRNSDGAPGMYDEQYDVFYTNAGTGTFVLPGIAPPSSLTVPDGLTIGTQFSAVWGASSDGSVTGYVLERSVNGAAFEQVYAGSGFVYADTPDISWSTVRYRVRATDGTNVSDWVLSDVRSVSNPYAPPSHNSSEQYTAYLAHLMRPFKKLVKLEFLQPDDSVAFALGGAGQKFPVAGRDSRTFLQSGSVSVNLANGPRRKASVVLANRDGAFDYAVNRLWFGQRVRLSMGMRLGGGEDLYFPMGVFYIENPSGLYSPNEKTMSLNLTDKWAYLDGSLFGNLEAAYSVPVGTNIFSAVDSVLNLSRYTYTATVNAGDKIDPEAAVYTSYYNGRTYSAAHSDGSITTDIAMTDTPYEITENRGSTFAALLLKLNEMLAGWIGYDAAGALRVEPSQDDIDDADKPVLFAFTPENSILLSRSETAQNTAVYNDVTVAGQGLTDAAVWARAVNDDPASDTNIHLIGRRVYVEEKADYWNADQCASLARWILKRKTVLQKSVTIECGQMFHLIENRLISVKRTDKAGQPVEKHLIQGFTVPIAETGSMSVTCASVNDLPDFTVTTSVS